MRLPPPTSNALAWLKVGVIPLEVVILGGAAWASHWDPNLGRSRRCAGAACALCAKGGRPQLRYVFLVRLTDGTEAWLELREAQYRDLLDLQEVYGDLVGMRLRVYKSTPHPRAKVVLERVGAEAVPYERDVSNFVARLGLPPLLLEPGMAAVHTITGRGAAEQRRTRKR